MDLRRAEGLLRDPRPSARAEGLRWFLAKAETGDLLGRDAFLRGAVDPDAGVRRLALRGLARARDAEAVDALLAALADEEPLAGEVLALLAHAWREGGAARAVLEAPLWRRLVTLVADSGSELAERAWGLAGEIAHTDAHLADLTAVLATWFARYRTRPCHLDWLLHLPAGWLRSGHAHPVLLDLVGALLARTAPGAPADALLVGAVGLLGCVGRPEAIPVLERAAASDRAELRAAARQSLRHALLAPEATRPGLGEPRAAERCWRCDELLASCAG